MKRVIALALALCLALLGLVSCGEGDVTTKNQGSTPTTTAGTILETKTPAGTNFGGEKIKIISRADDDYYDEISIEADEVANVIDQSVFDREASVEEKIGVDIVNDKKTTGNQYAQITDTIREHFRAGIDEYQIAVNNYYHSMDASLEDCFWNLAEIDTITLDMPWYSQYFVEEAALPNGLYFVTGDALLSRLRFVFATFFNKPLLESYSDVNVYKMVDDGAWTIDEQAAIVATIYEDADGSGTSDDGDVYGLGTFFILGVDPYWSAFELPLVGRDGDTLVNVIDNDKMVTALEKLIDLFHNNSGTYIVPRNGADLELIDAMQMFSSNQFVFMTNRLLSVESEYLTDMENAYGILPMPKLDADQEDYYSYSHDLMSVIGIPGTVAEEDLEMIGTVIEELSAYSYNFTREAYFEIALKGRYARDEESRKTLDILVDNLRIDAGEIYSKLLGDIALEIRTLVKEGRTGWSTVHRSKVKIIQNGLDKLNGVK